MGLAAAATAVGGALAAATPMEIAAGVMGSAGLAGAAISGSAAQSAAKTQANAETSAANIQQQELAQTQANLAPYNQAGQTATTNLQNISPFSFSPTQEQLEQTPGYQFNLSQGLKSTQNSYAAQGLGSSGAALKGAAQYASGLADTTYQNQFSNALNTYNTNLGVQQNLANLGENAAAQTGQFNTAAAGNIGQTAVGAANAQAAGTVGSANAASGAIGSLGSAYLYSNLFNQNSTNSMYGTPVSTAATGYDLNNLPTVSAGY